MPREILKAEYKKYSSYSGALVARWGRKSSIPVMNLDTVRGRRKGDPQHKCCGKKCISPKAHSFWKVSRKTVSIAVVSAFVYMG